MNVIEELGQLTQALEAEEASIQAEENEAEDLERRAKDKRTSVKARKAQAEVERKYIDLIQRFMQEQNEEVASANDNLQSSFRRYTEAARETSADEAKFDEFSRSFADGVGVVYEVPADQEEEVSPVAIAS